VTFHPNYLAVVVAALVVFILGWLWYMPLFGKAWREARGITDQMVAEGQKDMGKTMVVIALSSVVMAWAVGMLAAHMHLATWMQGLKLGALCWVGFALTMGLIETMTSRRKMASFYIDTGYWLVNLVIMGIIISVWH
jgi:hypothetical protein